MVTWCGEVLSDSHFCAPPPPHTHMCVHSSCLGHIAASRNANSDLVSQVPTRLQDAFPVDVQVSVVRIRAWVFCVEASVASASIVHMTAKTSASS